MDVYLVKRCHGLDGYTVIDSAWSSEELALTYIHEGLGMVPQRDSEGWTIEGRYMYPKPSIKYFTDDVDEEGYPWKAESQLESAVSDWYYHNEMAWIEVKTIDDMSRFEPSTPEDSIDIRDIDGPYNKFLASIRDK